MICEVCEEKEAIVEINDNIFACGECKDDVIADCASGSCGRVFEVAVKPIIKSSDEEIARISKERIKRTDKWMQVNR